MQSIRLAFLSLIVQIFFPFLTVSNISSFLVRQVQLPPSFASTTFQNFQVLLIFSPKCPGFSTIQSCAPNLQMYLCSSLFLKFVFLGKLVSFCYICKRPFLKPPVFSGSFTRQCLYHLQCFSRCIFCCPVTEYSRLLRNVFKYLTGYTYQMIVTAVM